MSTCSSVCVRLYVSVFINPALCHEQDAMQEQF